MHTNREQQNGKAGGRGVYRPCPRFSRDSGNQSGIRCIVFDLGGVLVEVDGTASVSRWTGTSANSLELADMSLKLPAVRAFETGRINAQTFARDIVRAAGLAVSPGEFLAEFREWVRRPFVGCRQLLTRLKVDHGLTLACLSNTNSVHWERIRDEMSLGGFFDHVFLSHEIGSCKPDREAYDAVLAGMPFAARQMLFLDDKEDNVMAARGAGLQSERVDGVDGACAALRKLGVDVHWSKLDG